jgi:AcrR family transcriptional regulator
MSKSGLFGHFGSKEELELATIEAALEIFTEHVIPPAVAAKPGRERLMALGDAFFKYVEERVFPGGCFFAAVASELDTRPGKARDRVLEIYTSWIKLFEACVRDAQQNGEIDPAADASQVAFEAVATLAMGNMAFVMWGDSKILDRARQGFLSVLDRAASKRAKKEPAQKTGPRM